jgi:hypothetical protein
MRPPRADAHPAWGPTGLGRGPSRSELGGWRRRGGDQEINRTLGAPDREIQMPATGPGKLDPRRIIAGWRRGRRNVEGHDGRGRTEWMRLDDEVPGLLLVTDPQNLRPVVAWAAREDHVRWRMPEVRHDPSVGRGRQRPWVVGKADGGVRARARKDLGAATSASDRRRRRSRLRTPEGGGRRGARGRACRRWWWEARASGDQQASSCHAHDCSSAHEPRPQRHADDSSTPRRPPEFPGHQACRSRGRQRSDPTSACVQAS